jgi:hypothetical protein
MVSESEGLALKAKAGSSIIAAMSLQRVYTLGKIMSLTYSLHRRKLSSDRRHALLVEFIRDE